jgi:hypothetical protein
MESIRKNVFVSTPVASPQLPYNRVGLTPHMLMTYMPPRNRLSNNHRTRVVPVNRPKYVFKLNGFYFLILIKKYNLIIFNVYIFCVVLC